MFEIGPEAGKVLDRAGFDAGMTEDAAELVLDREIQSSGNVTEFSRLPFATAWKLLATQSSSVSAPALLLKIS